MKRCLNMGGPPSKAKYSLLTDSEQVHTTDALAVEGDEGRDNLR